MPAFQRKSQKTIPRGWWVRADPGVVSRGSGITARQEEGLVSKVKIPKDRAAKYKETVKTQSLRLAALSQIPVPVKGSLPVSFSPCVP